MSKVKHVGAKYTVGGAEGKVAVKAGRVAEKVARRFAEAYAAYVEDPNSEEKVLEYELALDKFQKWLERK